MMSIGKIARKLLGERFFPIAGRFYRSIFVDLNQVCQCLPPMKADAHLLDVGGGDGELINLILARYPRLRVTMIDIAPQVGIAIKPEFRERVSFMPSTDLKKFQSLKTDSPDIILISDVMHHIEPSARREFLKDLRNAAGDGDAVIVFKDVEPGYFIAALSVFSDRHISGDKKVRLLSRRELVALMKDIFADFRHHETDLFKVQKPNYCLVFTRDSKSGA